MPWRYNPKTLNFESYQSTMPPAPPPLDDEPQDYNYDSMIQEERLDEEYSSISHGQNDDDQVFNQVFGYDGEDGSYEDDSGGSDWDSVFPTAPRAPRQEDDASDWDSVLGGSRTHQDGESRQSESRNGGQTSRPLSGGQSRDESRADTVVPGASAVSKIPAPDGYAWAIDPVTKQTELVDLTPLDPTKPLAGWKWLVDDPNGDPSKGRWSFLATPDVLDKPFEGVPKPIIQWLQVALDHGGDLSKVPDGPARAWVNYLMTRATEAGAQRPDEVPFGLGLPNFPKPPEMEGPPGATPGTPPGTTTPPVNTADLQGAINELKTMISSAAPRADVIAKVRIIMQLGAGDSRFDRRTFFRLLEQAGYSAQDFATTTPSPTLPTPPASTDLQALLASFGLTTEQSQQILSTINSSDRDRRGSYQED